MPGRQALALPLPDPPRNADEGTRFYIEQLHRHIRSLEELLIGTHLEQTVREELAKFLVPKKPTQDSVLIYDFAEARPIDAVKWADVDFNGGGMSGVGEWTDTGTDSIGGYLHPKDLAGNQNVVIGSTTDPDPFGQLYVEDAGAGSGATSSPAGTVITADRDEHSYISILTADGFKAGVFFGQATNTDAAFLTYDPGAAGSILLGFDSTANMITITPTQVTLHGNVVVEGDLTIKETSVNELRLNDLDGSTYTGFKSPDVLTASAVIYTLPAADGNAGEQLTTDGNKVLTWAPGAEWTDTGTALHPADLSGAEDVIIGGTILGSADILLRKEGGAIFNQQAETGSNSDFIVRGDASTDLIRTVASTNLVGIDAVPATDKLEIGGNVGVLAQNELRLYDLNSSNFVSHKSTDPVTVNRINIWPDSHGSGAQFLQNDGAGALSWATPTDLGPEWTDTGTFLHPADLSGAEDVGVGGTDLAGSDVLLRKEGGAVFNQQQGGAGVTTSNVLIMGDTDADLVVVNADTNTVGVGTTVTTDKFQVNGDIGVLATGAVVLYDSDNSNFISHEATGTVTSNRVNVWPDSHGSGAQFLQNNGGGSLTWATPTDTDTLPEWTDTGTFLHPADLSGAEDVGIGGTTTGGADILLRKEGGAVFNQQKNDSDLQIKGVGEDNLFYVDTSTDRIGIFTNAPTNTVHILGSIRARDVFVSGISTESILVNGVSIDSQFRADSDLVENLGQVLLTRHSDFNVGTATVFGRSRGTHDAVLAVGDNDTIGNILGLGHDGTDYERACAIHFEVDGTPGNDVMPGRLVFFTTPSGSNVLSERMRIDAAGNVGIGVTSSGDLLQVNGDIGALATGAIVLYDSDNSNFISHEAVGTVTSNRVNVWPDSHGSGAQFLQNDGAGALAWATPTDTDTLPEWTDTGTFLHPKDLSGAEDVGIGGTTLAGCDVLLRKEGGAIFNQQSGGAGVTTSDVQFRGDTDTNLVYINADTNTVGVGTTVTTDKLQVNGDIGALAQGAIVLYDNDNSNFVSHEAGATITSNRVNVWPDSHGSGAQFLQNNGSGTLAWATPPDTDTLPEWTDTGTFLHPADLSGAEDVGIGGTVLGSADILLRKEGGAIFNQQAETGSNSDFIVRGDASTDLIRTVASTNLVGIDTVPSVEKLEIDGNVGVLFQGEVRLYDLNNSNYVSHRSADPIGTNRVNTWPDSHGSGAQFLQNDGAGALAWATPTDTDTLPEWTDTGTFLHPKDLSGAEDVGIGGTTTGGSDILLRKEGGAIFNQQQASGTTSDFIVMGDTDADLITADASGDKVGIGVAVPGDKLQVDGDIGALATGAIVLYDSDSSHFISHESTGTVTSNRVNVWPDSHGSGVQFLQNNGTGTLAWATPTDTDTLPEWTDTGTFLHPKDLSGAEDVGVGGTTTGGCDVLLRKEGGAIFNQQLGGAGVTTSDVQVKGDTDTNLVYINADSNTVGIGTTVTTDKFQVNGDIGALANGAIVLYDSDNSHFISHEAVAAVTSNRVNVWPDSHGSGAQFLQNNGAGALVWATPAGGASEWTDNGGVLHPADSSGAQDVIVGDTTTGNADIWLKPLGGAVFNAQGLGAGVTTSDFSILDDGGNPLFYANADDREVGIGTTSPDSKLHVQRATGAAAVAKSGTAITAEGDDQSFLSFIITNVAGAGEAGLYVGVEADDDHAGFTWKGVSPAGWTLHAGGGSNDMMFWDETTGDVTLSQGAMSGGPPFDTNGSKLFFGIHAQTYVSHEEESVEGSGNERHAWVFDCSKISNTTNEGCAVMFIFGDNAGGKQQFILHADDQSIDDGSSLAKIQWTATANVNAIGAEIRAEGRETWGGGAAGEAGSRLVFATTPLTEVAPVDRFFIDHNGAITIGNQEAGVDYSLTFAGQSNQIVLTAMEDENRLDISSHLLIGNKAAGVDYAMTFNGETNVITLTAMEDENRLDITSSVDIAKYLAVGSSAVVAATVLVNVDEIMTTPGTNRGIYVNPTFTFNATSSASQFGAQVLAEVNGWTNSGFTLVGYGFQSEIDIAGTNDIDTAYAGRFVVDMNSTATSINTTYGVSILIDSAASTTTTTSYGLHLDLANSGTITTYYGIYINDIVEGTQTNAYAMWINEGDVVLDGDGNGSPGGTDAGCDLWMGEGLDGGIYYDGTQMVIHYQRVGTGGLMLKNATSTPGTPVGGPILYNKNDGELYVKDTAGNETPLSPHEGGDEWIFQCINKRRGKKIRINMEKFIKSVERLLGEKHLIEEFFEPEWD